MKDNKVILINPPQIELKQPNAYIPLGLAYLGSVLMEHEFNVEVMNLASEQNIDFDEWPLADVYAITCFSAVYDKVVEISRKLKSMGKYVVIGGVHPSLYPVKTKKETKCDVVLEGESEYTLPAVCMLQPHNSIIRCDYIKDLNSLPTPARHLFNIDDVVDTSGIHGQQEGDKATTMIGGRGCPYSCSFCMKPDYASIPRFRSPQNIIDEIDELVYVYNINHIRFIDDVFTLSRKHTAKLCDMMVNEELDVTWTCITRADLLSEPLLRKMSEAKCTEIHIGVESGSQYILHSMNKLLTVEENVNAIKMIQKYNMSAKAYLMVNYPGESDDDVELTKQFMVDAKPDKWTLSNYSEGAWYYPDENADVRYREFYDWLKSGVWKR